MLKTKLLKSVFSLSVITALLVWPPSTLAQSLSSPNFRIDDPEVDVGGGVSSSSNFQSQDALSGEESSKSSSSNFNSFSGFIQRSFPHVPGTPTLVNTGGALSNALDFVITQGSGNGSDVEYAIAISSDNFVTTSYVQADDTVGVSAAWQNYIAWGGGTGQRITGLLSSTTYKIKVKARYAVDTETAFSNTASAATIAGGGTLSFTVSGVSSGVSVAGATTSSATSATSIGFTNLVNATDFTIAQILAVDSASGTGYTVTAQADRPLTNTNTGATIGDFPATATDNAGIEGFGYGLVNKTNSDAVFTYNQSGGTFVSKGFQTTPVVVMSNGGPVSGSEVYVAYRLRIGPNLPAGGYSNQITYTAQADF